MIERAKHLMVEVGASWVLGLLIGFGVVPMAQVERVAR